MEFDIGNNSKEYEVEAIRDSAFYVKKSESGNLSGLYYLVSWEEYLKEENIWEPSLPVQHLRKLISSFYKDYTDKLITTFPNIDSSPLIARPLVKSIEFRKQKQTQVANNTNKQTKK